MTRAAEQTPTRTDPAPQPPAPAPDPEALANEICEAYLFRDFDALTQRHGSPANAIRAVGVAVENRAHEIAGISAAEVQTRFEERYRMAQEACVLDPADDRLLERMVTVRQGDDVETRADLARLRSGYLAALTELRPMGGRLGVSMPEDFDPTSWQAMRDAADCYPSSWIDMSNGHASPLFLTRPGPRGAYRADAEWAPSVGEPMIDVPYVADGDAVRTWTAPEREWTPAPELLPADAWEWEEGFRVTSYEVVEFVDQPDGDRWERWHDEANPERIVWRRPRLRNPKPGEWQDVSTICLSMGRESECAVHELGHRMEHVVPDLDAMIEDWRISRETLPDGTREAPRHLGKHYGDDEISRWDHYPAAYVGRVYASGSEVLSMGAESLFSGMYGGLVGASKQYEADPDFRAFVLGVLACAGR